MSARSPAARLGSPDSIEVSALRPGGARGPRAGLFLNLILFARVFGLRVSESDVRRWEGAYETLTTFIHERQTALRSNANGRKTHAQPRAPSLTVLSLSLSAL